MARLSQEKINEIRQSVDIVDVIGEYLPLEKKGRNYIALCPFHDDKHPSMSVSPDKQIFMCFVCGTGGNVFTFLQKYLKISYIEAVKKVAEIGHIDLSEYHLDVVSSPISKENASLYQMHEEAQKIYSYYLNTKLGLEAKAYLTKRHFSDELIKEFQIGYAPLQSTLYQAFEKLGFQEIDMVKSGLIVESYQHFDRFQDRIMFPLYNQQGQVVGFSGRIYKPTQTDSKYINSPESDIFIKGQTLYHYHQCKEAVKEAGFIYLLEGFMDVIAMYKAGIENTVAIMGTALTKGHIQALRRLTHHVHLCLDGDQAGQTAMSKAARELEEAGFQVSIIVLPDNHDPDEIYEEHGKEGLQEALKKTLKPIEFLMNFEYQKIDSQNYDDRKNYLEKMCYEIAKIHDPIDQDYYIQVLSKQSGFSYDLIHQQINGMKPQFHQETRVSQKKITHLKDKYQQAEHDLLFYMLNHKSVALKYEAKAGFMYNDQYRIIASYIIDYYRHHNQLEIADLINSIQKEDLIQTVVEIAQSPLPQEYEEKAIDDYIETIGNHAKKMKKEQLLEQFRYILDPQQKAQILNEIVKLGGQ
ncbi:DNA primase [Clostridium sp. AUH-JLR23]|uniref:DNA primase n=1 Tax=Clostridium sp. AUH-JLR23 TaxID=1505062 RepID=UPI003564B1AF